MIREATEKDRGEFNRAARHPLQSWEWGEFREKTGVLVSRLVEIENKKIKEVYQITWHKIPKLNKFIGYCPKSAIPSMAALTAIREEAEKRKAVLVKFEPNEKVEEKKRVSQLEKEFSFVPGKALFTKFTFQLDIAKTEADLLAGMHQKTRYNLRLAEKKGVVIEEDNSDMAFEKYWQLTEETTKRQRFYAHTKSYHWKMWKTMTESGVAHLLKAAYQGETLVTWIVFVLNGVLYYPYGASSNRHREVMASNLMMWEAIKFGKKKGCKLFDMWGSLGPGPDARDPWFGFHKFKQGYGGNLIEFVGTYDLVINQWGYRLYDFAERIRWLFLKTMAWLRR